MKKYKLYLLSSCLFLAFSNIYAEKGQTAKRFYAGNIIKAEVKPDNPELPIVIKNVSQYEPESQINTDVGYAVVTVNLDSGRTLGLYDYSLVTKQNKFPCVALAAREGDFDQENWELTKTSPSKKYTMLFKVQLPPMGPAKYNLRFNLMDKKWKDIPLEFINVGSKPFTRYKDIPFEGLLGIDPSKPKPVEKVEEKKADDATAGEKKADEKKVEAKPEKKLSKAEAKRLADLKAWDASNPKTEEKKAEPAKKEDAPKKGKKDAWDDWK